MHLIILSLWTDDLASLELFFVLCVLPYVFVHFFCEVSTSCSVFSTGGIDSNDIKDLHSLRGG